MGRVVSSARVCLGLGFAALCYFAFGYFEPILALRLNEPSYNLSTLMVGVIFALNAFFYIVGSPLLQFIPKNIEKRAIMLTGSLIVAACLILHGPSHYLGLPDDSLILLSVGFSLLGLFLPLMLVPCLPEIIEAASISVGERS